MGPDFRQGNESRGATTGFFAAVFLLNPVRSPPFYYGWVTVWRSFVVVMASFGLLFSYAVFAPSFAEALSLDAASVSAPFSVCVATYAILGLVTGRMTDRWGA